jgi:thioredoxin-related protein
MKKIAIILCWLVPGFANAQTKEGIKFQNIDSWKKVLEKAKTEKKNIFIDAFATWCGPCKKMDMEVYPTKVVGDFVTTNFIAIKVQFDETKNDPEAVKNWYIDAKYLMKEYQITAFPTFLFLSYDGKLIDKSIGYHDAENFLSLVRRANDPKQNYAGQVKYFEQDKLPDSSLLSLAFQAKDNHDDSLAVRLAKAYKKNVIDKASPEKIINPDLLKYFDNFYEVFTAKDKIVQFFYTNPKRTDILFGRKGFALDLSSVYIYREMIDPIVRPNGQYSDQEPNWTELAKAIASRYDPRIASELVLNSRIEWYSAKKEWSNIIKYKIEKLEKDGIDTTGIGKVGLNNLCYGTIFLHSDEPVALKKGIKYMEILLKSGPETDPWLDTYANLLYKLGNKEKAVQQEELALAIATKRNDKASIKEYQEVLRKMRNNNPTW